MPYVVKPRAWVADDLDDFYARGRETLDAIAEEDAPQATGLLDQHGNKLYRTRDKISFGFCKD